METQTSSSGGGKTNSHVTEDTRSDVPDIVNEPSPMDEIIARVDSYIRNPKSITMQTMKELRSELVDLKNYLDSEEQGEPQDSSPSENGKKPMLTILIGMHKKQGGD